MSRYSKMACVIAFVVLAITSFPRFSFALLECTDVNGDGIFGSVADVVYLLNYICKDGPLPNPDAEQIDGYSGITLNDVKYYQHWINDGLPMPVCSPDLIPILPVTDDHLDFRNWPVQTGDTIHRIDLWFTSANQIDAFSFSFVYASDLPWVRLDSIITPNPAAILKIDTLTRKGLIFWLNTDTLTFPRPGNCGLIASLYFSHSQALSDGRHIWTDTAAYSERNLIVFTKDKFNPVLPQIAEVAFYSYSPCGDIDGNYTINILDLLCGVRLLYGSGCRMQPPTVTDVDSSGGFNVLDLIYLINFLYKSGPEPHCPCR